MADLSKFTDKLGLQKIINDMKSIISPAVIPEANKDDPIGYCLSELSKVGRELADHHAKQADIIAKFSNLLESLHRELSSRQKSDASKDTISPPTEAAVGKETVSSGADSGEGSQ